MHDFISESLCGVRDATIEKVYNKFEDGRDLPPPELWINMAVRFSNPAIQGLTNSVQRAIDARRSQTKKIVKCAPTLGTRVLALWSLLANLMGQGRKPGPCRGAAEGVL